MRMTETEKRQYEELVNGSEQMGLNVGKVYGYARVSTHGQNLERQRANIKAEYPGAIIFEDEYTGAKISRPNFNKLLKIVKPGDTIVFDEVSRMSRNAEDGSALYKELYSNGIRLVFLKERYIDTDVFAETSKRQIDATGTEFDCVIKGINEYLMILAEKQIKIAFEQAQAELDKLHKRTSDGMMIAKANGKQIGRVEGKKYETKKSKEVKLQILKLSKDFNGSNNDIEVMKLTGLARNTYYKYKRELSEN